MRPENPLSPFLVRSVLAAGVALALLLPLPASASPAASDSTASAAPAASTTPIANTTPAASSSTSATPLSTGQVAANTVFIGETSRLRGKAAPFKVGQAITPFVLHNQDGEPLQLPTDCEGKHIVVSFIFTRCQVATMCPAATAKMTQLQRELAARGLSDKVQLVSITFDPRYDTPAVMRQYAQMFGAQTDNYAFLTAHPQLANAPQLTDALLRRFGILTRNADDTIVHTMTTSLIAPDGTLALQERGADWQAATFLDAIRNHSSAGAE